MSSEQNDEVEALQSIYGDDFIADASSSSASVTFSLRILPHGSSAGEDTPNHVGIALRVVFPATYPEVVPELTIPSATAKGLEASQIAELEALAKTSSEKSVGAPSIYETAEGLREWLLEHNEPQGSGSAYDEMIKRQRAAEKAALAATKSAVFSKDDDPSRSGRSGSSRGALSASAEEAAIRARKEGTPVTAATFAIWRAKFEAEQAAAAASAAASGTSSSSSSSSSTSSSSNSSSNSSSSSARSTSAAVSASASAAAAAEERSKRLTGRQLFESDSTLASSDVAAIEEIAATVSTRPVPKEGEFVVDPSLYLDGVDLEDDEEEWEEGDDEEEDDEGEELGSDDDDDDDEEDDDDYDGDDGGFFVDDDEEEEEEKPKKGKTQTASKSTAASSSKTSSSSSSSSAASASKGGKEASGKKKK